MRKVLLCLALVFAACGNETAEDLAEPTPAQTTGVQQCEERTPPAPEKEDEVDEKKPDVKIPDGAPPCKLVIQDIHKGDGAKAKAGDAVTAHYVGVSWSTGEQFDASWDRGAPAPFSLDMVIQGWIDGIPGMREGGRRRLIVPPDLGYGVEGRPDSGIASNETLLFIVDLVKVG